MINEKKLLACRKNMNTIFEKNFCELKNILKTIDNLELIAFLSFLYYITSNEGKHGIEPSTLEYIIGVSLSDWKENENDNKGTVEESLRVWQLGDELMKNWAGSLYFNKLTPDLTDEEITKKMFSISKQISYGFTRGYSWYRIIEERHCNEILEPINDTIEKKLGFFPYEIWKVIHAYEKYIYKKVSELKKSEISFSIDMNPMTFYEELHKLKYRELMSFRREDIYNNCPDVSKEHIDAILDFYKLDLDDISPFEFMYGTDNNPYWVHAILKKGEDYYIPSTHEIMWRIRERIEDTIKSDSTIWSVYDKKHKAKYLENESVRLFKKLLPQCEIYTSLYYYPEGCPSGCELDALALYDNIIILIEAKSNIYTKPAQRGALDRLEKTIETNIEYAYSQGNRTRNYILNSEEALFYENNRTKKEILRINKEKYEHIFIINTTLDYFAELGLDLYKLKKMGIYKENEFPWTVCLSDLEVISDFMDFPNQFIYYLFMRLKLNNTLSEANQVSLLYELDLLAMYKLENTEEYGKYECEALDEKVILDLLAFEEDDAMLQVQQKYSSDYSLYFYKYYYEYYKSGERPKITPKRYNPQFLSMCRQLEEYDVFGYSCFVLRFLDIDYMDQEFLMQKIEEVCEKSKADKRIHSLTIRQMPRQFIDERYGLVIYTGYVKDRRQIEAHASVAGAIQQALTGIKEWITLCIYLDDDRHFVNQFYFHFGDEKSGLLAKKAMQTVYTKKYKVGRNDLCPCGSGRKFKRCCGK